MPGEHPEPTASRAVPFWRATAPLQPIDSRDPFLTSELAPHESAGLLRMFRAGVSIPRICSEFGISKQQLIHEMATAIDDEAEATRIGVEIYDSPIPRGTQ